MAGRSLGLCSGDNRRGINQLELNGEPLPYDLSEIVDILFGDLIEYFYENFSGFVLPD